MVGFFVKLPFKVALLPLKVVRFALRSLRAKTEPPRSQPEARPGGNEHVPPPETNSSSPFDVQVDPASILERMKDGEEFTFIDVRQANELSASGMIEGSLHIPSQDLPRRMEELDQESELVVYCAAGVRSLDAVMFLREKGFGKAWSLGGGLPHWEHEGGQVVRL